MTYKMTNRIITSTVKLDTRIGHLDCDTTRGQFSVYLPLSTIDSKDGESLTLSKTSIDNNQITVWGQFPDEADFMVFGVKQKKISLICKDGLWRCL